MNTLWPAGTGPAPHVTWGSLALIVSGPYQKYASRRDVGLSLIRRPRIKKSSHLSPATTASRERPSPVGWRGGGLEEGIPHREREL